MRKKANKGSCPSGRLRGGFKRSGINVTVCTVSFTPVVAGATGEEGEAALCVSSYSEFIGVRVPHRNPRGTTSALECK